MPQLCTDRPLRAQGAAVAVAVAALAGLARGGATFLGQEVAEPGGHLAHPPASIGTQLCSAGQG